MSSRVAGALSAALVVASLQAGLGAQAPVQLPVPISSVSMADAVRLALERNQSLRAQRLDDRRVEGRRDHGRAEAEPRRRRSAPTASPLFSPSQFDTRTSLATTSATAPALELHVRARRQARQAHRWSRRTRPTSPPKTVARRRAAAARSRPSRRSSTCCSRSRRSTSRSRTCKSFSERRRGQPPAGDGRRSRRGRLLQDLAAEAAVRAGRLGRRGRPRAGARPRCGSCSGFDARRRTTSTSSATWRIAKHDGRRSTI